MSTVADSIQLAIRHLRSRSESARLDAEILLSKVLGMSRTALIAHGDDALPAASREAFDELIARRARGTPVAYLTGSREFWSLQLAVTPDVLVPRPATELLVECALTLCPVDAPSTVLDLGTGSGAIALAIASDRPQARVSGVDICADALAVARHNSQKFALRNVQWSLGSWFDAVPGARFDLIVANPPYVASGDPALLELTDEPLLALSPGPTGLEALTAIIGNAARHLNPHGWLLLEHGYNQAAAVAAQLERSGFGGIRLHHDHSGHPRVTRGTILSSH